MYATDLSEYRRENDILFRRFNADRENFEDILTMRQFAKYKKALRIAREPNCNKAFAEFNIEKVSTSKRVKVLHSIMIDSYMNYLHFNNRQDFRLIQGGLV